MDKENPISAHVEKLPEYHILRQCTEGAEAPVLSIAVPTYKRFELLKETLDSIFALDFLVPIEVLVVDNDPANFELAYQEISRYDSHSFTYYKNIENLGMFGNWNQCLKLAKGQYVTILHDDDLLLPAFAAQINELLHDSNTAPAIMGFKVGILDLRENRPESVAVKSGALKQLLKRVMYGKADLAVDSGAVDLFFANLFCGTLGVVMNREMALSIGGFNAEWYPIADYEFWCRWATHFGNIQVIQQEVGLYRMQQNESLNLEVRKNYIKFSTALRLQMIAEHAVPQFLKYFIGVIAAVQRKLVDLDWRTKDEADQVLFRVITLRVWRIVTGMLISVARKPENAKRLS
jgi:glycosyltransferase involved in cell wall biosynthesis